MRITELLDNIANFLQTTAREITYQKSGLKVRTGRLRNSIVAIPNYSRGSVSFGVGVVYGKIHELGGIVKPKNAKYLWIPTQANRTRAGVAKLLPKDVVGQGFVRKNVFFMKDGKGIRPMFVLKTEVKLPARYYMRDAVELLTRHIKTLVSRWEQGSRIFWKLPKGKGG